MVATKQLLDPQAVYKARLFVPWDGTYSTATYSITTLPAPAAEVSPAKLDEIIGWRRIHRIGLHIRNIGRVPIRGVEIVSTDLVDSANQERIRFAPPGFGLSLSPGTEGIAEFDLPDVSFAGTYVGTLDVSASGHHLGSATLTLKSRGPSGRTVLPLLLFFGVAAGGMALSFGLDRWFAGGGLARAQAILILYQCRTRLDAAANGLTAWKTTNNLPLPNTDRRIAAGQTATTDLLRNAEHADLGVFSQHVVH